LTAWLPTPPVAPVQEFADGHHRLIPADPADVRAGVTDPHRQRFLDRARRHHHTRPRPIRRPAPVDIFGVDLADATGLPHPAEQRIEEITTRTRWAHVAGIFAGFDSRRPLRI
jgi:hypothetical protein